MSKLIFWLMLPPFILSLIMIIFSLTALKFLPPRLPLFYSLAWGDKQLATHEQFLIIPAIISLITLTNILISWHLHPAQSFFKKILLLQSLTVSLILTITFSKIVLSFI